MPNISIIVPARNEENNLKKLVERIHSELSAHGLTYEVIVVDDSSTDGTVALAESLGKAYPLRVYKKKGKLGKAFSILEGGGYAESDIVCMIDADLQYDPKHIPAMVALLNKDVKTGVIVAERKTYKGPFLRRFASKFNKLLVGRIISGVSVDIQSGLKVFRRSILEYVDVDCMGPWSFDVPLLIAARDKGYSIKTEPIVFEEREGGVSKVGYMGVALDIVVHALKLRLTEHKRVYPIRAHSQGSMLGAGMLHKKKHYVTHTTLHHHQSALRVLKTWQRLAIIAACVLVGLGLWVNLIGTVIIVFAVLNALYFLDILFNLYMSIKTVYNSQEITSTPEEINAINDAKLPIYSVLCPLYREAQMIPQFVKAMSALDWPKDRLDVMLLLEEDDTHTIEAAHKAKLPSFVRVVVVPHSLPKTKPKASNYGLAHAQGEYVVIYDAEDIPDTKQLKKAYLGFQKAKSNVICLQAKLNYYNPHQNLLTRVFTAEYSLWFDLILPGLQSIDAPIPLGGTSNHFTRKGLIELEGWDSFNVTEDCDLGIRLAKLGYKTAIIDSVTMEEANSDLFNWINQRSRWIKGYIQSYLVHMRSPHRFVREYAREFFIFQLVVGGKVLALFVNPLMWFITIMYFVSRAHWGVFIEKLFPGPVLYMGVFSLIAGNFIYLYYYMIACAKRKQFSLIKYVYLVPLYWLAMSVAGWKALIQLFYKPHFWQKTTHGLHFEKVEPTRTSKVTATKPAIYSTPRSLSLRYITSVAFLFSIGASSVINFVANAYLGRVVSFEDLAIIGLVSSCISLLAIISGALSTTINYRTGFLAGKISEAHAALFWKQMRTNVLYVSIVAACLLLVGAPFFSSYFRTPTILPWLFLAPVVLMNFVTETDRGFLAGSMRFGRLALVNVSEPVVRIVLAILFVSAGFAAYTYTVLPLAIVSMGCISWYLARGVASANRASASDTTEPFPTNFFVLALLTGFSVNFFMSVDVLLANRYLSPAEAGQYALVSLIGKMIFFMGTFASAFTTPLISRYEGQQKNSERILYYTFTATAVIACIGYIIFGHFGHITAPFLFGEKAHVVSRHLVLISGGIAFFTISKVLSDYYLIKRHMLFSLGAIGLSIVQVCALALFHASLDQFVYVMAGIWSMHLIMNLLMHVCIGYVRKSEVFLKYHIRRYTKLGFALQSRESRLNDTHDGSTAILIFNWRDTRHKWAGGAEVYVHELARRWVRDGHKVTLFCGNASRNKSRETIDGVEVYRRGNFVTVYLWAILYYFWYFRGKYDVIIDAENGIPFFTPIYAKEKKFLLIHHVHQEVFRKSLPRPLAHLALFLEGTLMPLVYRNVQVVTVSPSSSNEIMKHKLTKNKPIIIYNGIDPKIFKPHKKSSTPLIMYLGRLQYYKSLNVFIRAAQQVLKNHPDAQFVIAGEGEERKKLEQFTRKLGIEKSLKFLGKVDHKTRVTLLQKAWLFMYPSYMEGWGISIIEANACGTPAVASNVPGLRDSVKNPHTGFLVEYGDYEGFARRIEELITDTNLREEMSKESVAWAQNFTWDKSASEFYGLILAHTDGKR